MSLLRKDCEYDVTVNDINTKESKVQHVIINGEKITVSLGQRVRIPGTFAIALEESGIYETVCTEEQNGQMRLVEERFVPRFVVRVHAEYDMSGSKRGLSLPGVPVASAVILGTKPLASYQLDQIRAMAKSHGIDVEGKGKKELIAELEPILTRTPTAVEAEA